METLVLFMRHEKNLGNQLKIDGINSARITGSKLKAQGEKLNILISSPQWRCLETIQNLLIGYNEMIPLHKIDYRFGDIKLDPNVDQTIVKNIFAKASAWGVEKEEIYFKDKAIKNDLLRRGREGLEAILDAVAEHPGKTILICSHGGSRMEPTICSLLEKDISDPPFIFKRGSIAKIVFDGPLLKYVKYSDEL